MLALGRLRRCISAVHASLGRFRGFCSASQVETHHIFFKPPKLAQKLKFRSRKIIRVDTYPSLQVKILDVRVQKVTAENIEPYGALEWKSQCTLFEDFDGEAVRLE
eukprot:1335029-Amorphochlora_amoeboformis.AAC.1